MALIVRNDEQIKVGTTPGLIAGESFFIFDGTSGKPDYRQSEIVISELNGRGILIKFLDYTWDPVTGRFDLIQRIPFSDIFPDEQYYNVHFQLLPQPLVFDHYSFINSSFFIRDINLVNLTETKVLERINYFIAKYETECLRKILGLELYNAVLTESSQRMTDLAYGANYYTPLTRWYGLVHDINISLIANYVYYYFQESNALQTVGTSTKASKSEAGVSESPAQKMVKSWQFFASETRAMCSFLWNKTDFDVVNGTRTYPEFTSEQYLITMDIARKGGVNKFGF